MLQTHRMIGMRLFCRPQLLILLMTALLAASCGSCGACDGEEIASDVDAGEADVERGDVVEDTRAEDLAEARKEAEERADSLGFHTGQNARMIAAELEGEQTKPQSPNLKRAPKSNDDGKIDVDKVQRVFDQNHANLQKCYERALKGDPNLQGQVTLTVRIGADGSPALTRAKSQAIANQTALDCMEREAKSWRFPKPTGGTVMLNKPFRFTPDN